MADNFDFEVIGKPQKIMEWCIWDNAMRPKTKPNTTTCILAHSVKQAEARVKARYPDNQIKFLGISKPR